MVTVAAWVAAAVLSAVVALQVLLAAGAPLGRFAWGGQHTVLPVKLRVGSAASVPMLALAGFVALSGAGVVPPGPGAGVRMAAGVLAGAFALNTLGNLASASPAERWVMTPATVVLGLCFARVAFG